MASVHESSALVAQQRKNMVNGQVKVGTDVVRASVLAAMGSVPREVFVRPDLQSVAYAEARLPLVEGRILLSPYEYARLLEAADIAPDATVWVIAGNTGYLAALVRHLTPHVVMSEHDAALLGFARAVAVSADIQMVHQVDVNAGLPEHGSFDRIIVDGGAEVLPLGATAQLAPGGKMIVVDRSSDAGVLLEITRDADGNIGRRPIADLQLPALAVFAAPEQFRFSA